MALKSGFRQTDMGILPEGWEVFSLEKLSNFVTSGSRGWAEYYSDSGPIFVRSQNVRDGRLDFTDLQHVSPPMGAEGSRTKVQKEDLLITITGNSVGNVACVHEELGEAYISQHVGLVRLSNPRLSEYICRYLAPGAPGNPQISGSQTGQSKPGLNLKNLRDFCVALPPTEIEQEAIANALSDVDAYIGSLEKMVAKKRLIKKGVMAELLLSNDKAGSWKLVALHEIATISKGTQPTKDFFDGNEAYPFLNGGMSPSGFVNRWNKDANTIAISEGGNSCGYVQLVNDRFWCGGHCYSVTPQKVENDFLYHALKAQEANIMGMRVGSGLPNIQKKNLLNFQIYISPSPEEQQRIANILTDIDLEIKAHEQSLKKVRLLKQGMMQELLTGRIRLI